MPAPRADEDPGHQRDHDDRGIRSDPFDSQGVRRSDAGDVALSGGGHGHG